MAYDPVTAGARCAECPLSGRRVVPPEGPDGATFVIVGETPGYEEEIRGRPFIGPSGRLLEEMLAEHGVLRERLWITNTILCRPFVPDLKGAKKYDLVTFLAWIRATNKQRAKAGQPTIASPIDCCAARLTRELVSAERAAQAANLPNGAVVLALGNHATRALTGKQGIARLRGSPVPVEIGQDGTLTARWDPRPEVTHDTTAGGAGGDDVERV